MTGSKPTAGDLRARLPRFSGEDAAQNQPLVAALHRFAAARGVTPAQLAIAWVRAKGAELGVTVIPTIGARTPRQVLDAAEALGVALTPEEVRELEVAVPADAIAGSRCPAPMMVTLDSER